jgi:hypothetical protein
MLKIPTREEADLLLAEAGRLNPGPWQAHSQYVARAAETIAARHPGLDPEPAYILGLLHDIGRRAGSTDMRHVLDGCTYLAELGYPDAAQICLTHSFPVKNIHAGAGRWDCTPEELRRAEQALAQTEYSDYDRLIQLCDCLALPTGFCLIEKRLVDVALRHGFNDLTLAKWRAFLQIQRDFEAQMGGSIYTGLAGIVATTFGTDLGG